METKKTAPSDVIEGVRRENIRKLKHLEGCNLKSNAFIGVGKLSVNNPDQQIRVAFGSDDSLVIQFVLTVARDSFTALVNGNQYEFTVHEVALRRIAASHPAIKQ